MGCFPACFGHLRRNLTTKKVQHQCLCPSNEQNERVKLLPEITKPQKEEEEMVNPIKDFMSQSEVKHEDKISTTHNVENPFFDHSNLKKEANELAISNGDKEVVGNEKGDVEEKENEKGNDDISDSNFSFHGHEEVSIDEKECAVEEESCSSLFSLSIDSRRQVYGAEMGEKEVSSILMKTKHRSLGNDEEKENVALSNDPVIIQQTLEKSKPTETSLSTWLVESRTSGGSSPESENNYGDRQVLGVVSSTADVEKEEPDFNRWINVEGVVVMIGRDFNAAAPADVEESEILEYYFVCNPVLCSTRDE